MSRKKVETNNARTAGAFSHLADPELDLSRLADSMGRIADAIAPDSEQSDPESLDIDIEVMSYEMTEKETGETGPQKFVTYVVGSSKDCDPVDAYLSIRFLFENDPLWRAGQKLKISVTVCGPTR